MSKTVKLFGAGIYLKVMRMIRLSKFDNGSTITGFQRCLICSLMARLDRDFRFAIALILWRTFNWYKVLFYSLVICSVLIVRRYVICESIRSIYNFYARLFLGYKNGDISVAVPLRTLSRKDLKGTVTPSTWYINWQVHTPVNPVMITLLGYTIVWQQK